MPTNSLEQQALDRVARMYSTYDRSRGMNRSRPDPAPESPSAEPEKAEEAPRIEPERKSSGLMDILLEDKEQSLLLLLLIILMKDGADLNLILALMYLVI